MRSRKTIRFQLHPAPQRNLAPIRWANLPADKALTTNQGKEFSSWAHRGLTAQRSQRAELQWSANGAFCCPSFHRQTSRASAACKTAPHGVLWYDGAIGYLWLKPATPSQHFARGHCYSAPRAAWPRQMLLVNKLKALTDLTETGSIGIISWRFTGDWVFIGDWVYSLAAQSAANSKWLASICTVRGTRIAWGRTVLGAWTHLSWSIYMLHGYKQTFPRSQVAHTLSSLQLWKPISTLSSRDLPGQWSIYSTHSSFLWWFCFVRCWSLLDKYPQIKFQMWSWEYNSSCSFDMLLLPRQYLEIRTLSCTSSVLEVQIELYFRQCYWNVGVGILFVL